MKQTFPVINLSSHEVDTKYLEKTGLDYSYIDKNKYIKRNIAVELEAVANTVSKDIKPDERENFHEFLRGSTKKFTENVYQTKDKTFHSLKDLRNNERRHKR